MYMYVYVYNIYIYDKQPQVIDGTVVNPEIYEINIVELLRCPFPHMGSNFPRFFHVVFIIFESFFIFASSGAKTFKNGKLQCSPSFFVFLFFLIMFLSFFTLFNQIFSFPFYLFMFIISFSCPFSLFIFFIIFFHFHFLFSCFNHFFHFYFLFSFFIIFVISIFSFSVLSFCSFPFSLLML